MICELSNFSESKYPPAIVRLSHPALEIDAAKSSNKKYFDVNKWATYMAFMDAFQTLHGTEPSSVKFYLNPINGLIEPVFWDGHFDKWHRNTRLSDIAFNYSSENECSQHLRGSIHAVNVCNVSNWYKLLFGIPGFYKIGQSQFSAESRLHCGAPRVPKTRKIFF